MLDSTLLFCCGTVNAHVLRAAAWEKQKPNKKNMGKIICCVFFIKDTEIEGTIEKIQYYKGGLESLCLCEVRLFAVPQIMG